MRTESSDESLSDDCIDWCWKKKCRYPHIQNTCECLCCWVRMYCRDNKMTSKCSFYRNIYSLMITDFSYHYNIWILTQSSTKSECKSIPNIRKHLRLIEPVDLTFYWIFKSHYIYIRLIQHGKAWIQCCWFTRTSWSWSQNNSIWKFNSFLEKEFVVSF